MFERFPYSCRPPQAEKLMNKKHSQLVLFIAWLVFFPIVQYLVQNELNAKAAA
jgi:hypothetical protein